MALGDVYTLSDVAHVNADDPLVNVFHLRDTDGAGSQVDLLTKWEANGWLHHMVGLESSDVVYDVVNNRLLIPYGTGSLFVPHTTDVAGALSEPVGALNMAAVVTWYTGAIGRRKRGRTFMFGNGNATDVKGLWNTSRYAAWQTAITAFLNYWKTGGGSGHYELGVWSRRTAGTTPPFNPAAFTPIVVYTARTFMRSQRRRNFGISIGRGA